MMNFHPIQDQRLSDRIAQQFTQAMQSGELTVGTRLPPEAQLADQLGVSRGILREALTILEARGYLSRTPKGGTFIKSVVGDSFARSLSEELRHATYRDLLEFREVMECRAVQNIIHTASDEQIDALYGLLDEPPEEAEAASQLDRYFHFQLAKLSGNRLFSCFIDTYYELIREIKTRSMRTESRRAAVMREHRAILDALRARDVEAAQERVRRHLDAVRASLEKSER